MSTGYLAQSTLSLADRHLDLQTALGVTPAGTIENPQLFRGLLARPDVAAAGLLAVADVAATTYADFGLAKRVANLDPVVTASGDRLRFESFSGCNGVHARFDLLPTGIDTGDAAFGTTNVDINQPLRSALSAVHRAALLHLSVGDDELRISTPDATFVERKVTLPERWVRGFAETPLLAHATRSVAELRGPAIGRFLSALPNAGMPGPDLHLAAGPTGITRRLDRGPGTFYLAGSGRLRSAARIARFATALHVFSSDTGTSGWVFDLPGGRFTLLLTPGAYRGFSGEGSLLVLLSQPEAEAVGRRLAHELAWQPLIDPTGLARDLSLTSGDVDAGLAWLAASGRIGYDLAEARWFHRELPIDADAILRRNPRLEAAQKLVGHSAVHATGDGWTVTGSRGTPYSVAAGATGYTCTCAWQAEHHGTRGACKHVLAVLLSRQAGQRPANHQHKPAAR